MNAIIFYSKSEGIENETCAAVRLLEGIPLLRSFPSIALHIPTAHNFTRDLRTPLEYGGFFFAAGPRHIGKLSFLQK